MKSVATVNGWTDERVETLKAMLKNGASASQIARALGNLSRNAVIGKVHRLGLAFSRRQGRGAGVRHSYPPVRKAKAPPPKKPAEVIRDNVARAELELPPTDDPFGAVGCRWPIGEVGAPDFRFCQRPRTQRLAGGESSWCAEHHALGHQHHTEAFGKHYGDTVKARIRAGDVA